MWPGRALKWATGSVGPAVRLVWLLPLLEPLKKSSLVLHPIENISWAPFLGLIFLCFLFFFSVVFFSSVVCGGLNLWLIGNVNRENLNGNQ